MDKLYIVRKYIMAKSAEQAIKKDKNCPVDDVWVDEDWRNEKKDEVTKIEHCSYKSYNKKTPSKKI
jgi:hypothetical protein